MIPTIMRLKIKDGKKKGLNLWIPLFIIWILLLPLALVVFIVWLFLHAFSHLNSKIALGAAALTFAFIALCNLRGLRVNVKSGNDDVIVYFI